MFTTIPADLSGLNLTALRELLATSRQEVRDAATSGEMTAAQLAEAHSMRDNDWPRLTAEISARAAAEPADAAEVSALADLLGDEPAAEPATEPAAEAATEPAAEAAAEPAAEPAAELATEASAQRTSRGSLAAAQAITPPAASTSPTAWVTTRNTGSAGRELLDSLAVARELINAVENLGTSDTKVPVAVMRARFAEGAALLENDAAANFRRFSPAEIQASLCAPAEPLYDLACYSSTVRPVANSLVARQAERGKVSVYPSPTLSDITTNATGNAVGVWTSADDTTPASEKGYTEITCGTPVTYEIYAVYRAIRVRELLLRTFPELVDAYLNKLEALWARTAEIQLLAAMFSGTTAVGLTPADVEGYGATVATMRRIETLLSFHRDQERWEDGVQMNAYVPRWFLSALRLDQMSRRGGSVPSVADINRQFADVGANLIPVMDRPSWQVADGVMLNGSSELGRLPNQVKILLTPADKFAMMERGDLSVGVRGAGMRDSALVSKNSSQIFYESFEGIVDLNSCPAYTVHMTGLKYSGHQIDDIILDGLGVVPPAV